MIDMVAPAPVPELGLVLRIAGGRPVLAGELGTLLNALARDYRALNRGRNLVIARIDHGSILIELKDAALVAAPYLKDGAALAGGFKALLELGKGLKSLIARKKAASPDADDRRGPYRSVEAIIKIAADAGAEISGRQEDGAGGVLEFHMAPKDAVAIRQRERDAVVETAQPSLIPPPSAPRIGRDSARLFADEIAQLASTGAAGEIHPLVRAIVRLLTESGNVHLIAALQKELAARGHGDLAAAVRREAEGA